MTDTSQPASSKQSDDSARAVGRGALFIALGKVVFLIAGATINFVLPRLLSKADYGNYGVVVRVVSLLNMTTVIGLLQSVSKLVSEQPELARQTLRRALGISALAAGGVALVYAACAPLLAGALRDAGLALPFAVSAAITLGYGVYAVALGTVNGLQHFRTQALLDMAFSVFKVSCILGGAVLLGGLGQRLFSGLPGAEAGYGSVGGIAGFATAASLVAGLALLSLRGLPVADATAQASALPGRIFVRRLLLFAGSVMLYQASLNGLMSADLLLVKRHFSGELGAAAGVYNGAVNVAQLPYFGVLAITLVAFPLISSTSAAKDRETTARYLRTAFRFGALIAVAVCAVVAASARDVLELIFPAGYSEGHVALAVLVCGYGLLALHSICSTVLNAAGFPTRSFAATISGVGLSVLVTVLLIPPLGLVGAAFGTLVGGCLALALSIGFLKRKIGATPALGSTLRIVLAGALVALGGQLLPLRGALWVVPFSLAAGLVFLAILVALRELGRDDLQMVLAPFRRRRS